MICTATIKPRNAEPFEAWLGGDYVAKRHGPSVCPCCSNAVYISRTKRRTLAGSKFWRIGCSKCDAEILGQAFRDTYADDILFQQSKGNSFLDFIKRDGDEFQGGSYMIPVRWPT